MKKKFILQQFIKDLKQKAESDDIERILVGAIVIFNNKILIIKRSSKDEFLPGYFEIPGGKLEKNEEIVQGMQRELREETDMEIKTIYEYAGSFDAVSPDGKKARQFNFLIKPTNNHVRLSEEHSQYFWWDFKEMTQIPALPMIDAMKIILQKVVKHIKKDPSTRSK